MKLLHTSDWHVGKVLKGLDRTDEHRLVLSEIVSIAQTQQVDVVLVVGDLFETSLPTPEAQKLVWQTLMALKATGAEVIVIAGNHDSPSLFEAMTSVFGALDIAMVGRVRRPTEGGIIRFNAKSTGEPVEVALLPFVSQRGIVTSLHLLGEDMAAAQLNQTYASRVNKLITALTNELSPSAVRIFAAHAHVNGGKLGGGERQAQSIFDYGIEPSAFPNTMHYVALGHLHRRQLVPGPCPIHYCGSPIQVDFGEQADNKTVLIVEASPTTPARITEIALTSPRTLRIVQGTEAELEQLTGTFGEALLRIRVVDTKNSVGLADRVRAWHPNALEVRIDPTVETATISPGSRPDTKTPAELFSQFLLHINVDDERLDGLFNELHDEVTSAHHDFLLSEASSAAGGAS